MTFQSPSTRRDRRFALPRGSSTAELDGHVAVLDSVGACGFTCELAGGPGSLEMDCYVSGVVLRIGGCVVRGDAVVRNLRDEGEHTVIGCMFYPASTEAEERWMTVLAGVEAAQPGEASGG